VKNELRIIGGIWRSRKLRFPDVPGLRPTPDRVRETLFNWLGQDMEGLSCLDLFAGSGALGFEAASRGAKRVVQVERNAAACLALKQSCAVLEARTVEVMQADVMRFLAGKSQVFDVVFLDPPFQQNFAAPCCLLLEKQGWLAPNAKIYVETEAGLILDLPSNWQVLREKTAGEVACHLYQHLIPSE
jgi:16S rRNA (guanine966-N2)-methyltransferase